MADKIKEKINEFLGESYTRIKHSSGLEIYVIPKDNSTSYALYAAKFGSAVSKFKESAEEDFTEIPDGTAHFMEHKMFENEDGEDTFAKYARFGADPNAYTAQNRTVYLFSCTSNEHENLEVLLNLVTKPYYTDANIAKEQGIIGQEIGMYENDAYWKLIYGAYQGMYKNNPVRIDTAGTVESIAKINKELLYKLYSDFYDPSNMVLVLCGKFDKDKVIGLVNRTVPKTKHPSVVLPEIKEPVKANRKKTEISMDVAKPMFTVGIKDPNTENTGKAGIKKSIVTDILIEAMFGPGSDFYCENYEAGIINNRFEAEQEISYGYSHVLISGEADNPDAAVKKIHEQCETTAKKGISKADFERCKRIIYSRIIMSFEKSDSFANGLYSALLVDGDILDIPSAVSSVKLSEVNARAKELLVPDAMTLSLVKPLKK